VDLAESDANSMENTTRAVKVKIQNNQMMNPVELVYSLLDTRAHIVATIQ
jgi:hypothetical protein